MEDAWDITQGDNVRVGLFESGIDIGHEDLVGRIEPGNFIPATGTDLSHGTHVGGIVSAVSNNIGIAGISQATLSLLNRKDFVGSLEYAEEHGIDIINASFYYTRELNGETVPALPDASHRQAIETYGLNGGILICSAGNAGNNTDESPQYPAGYGNSERFSEIVNVISVGSITRTGSRSSFSNFGSHSVHIYAPGESIYSTLPNNDYGSMNGTSMAAPHVTGVAALILSMNPELTPAQVKQAILDGAENIIISTPNGNQNVLRLNAYNALLAANNLPKPPKITVANTSNKWDITITNPNEFEVTVLYNERMCFEDDAKNFQHMTNLRSFRLSALGSRTVRISEFGTAGYVAACFVSELSNGSIVYRVSYADGISASGLNTPKYNTVVGGSIGNSDLVPNYLDFELTARYGITPYEWDVKLINTNSEPISVTFNDKMCYDDAARNFMGLRDLADVTIPANDSITVRISGNGVANYITAAINYSVDGIRYRRISSVNGLTKDSNGNFSMNSIRHNEVVVASSFPEVEVPPNNLILKPVSRTGFIYYTWDVEIKNTNSYSVEVSYNAKLCFEGDASNYDNLADIVTIVIPANSTRTVTINHNGTAGWITASINYSYKGYEYRAITYANGLAVNSTNTPKYKIVRFTN